MLDCFAKQHSELVMSRRLKVCLSAKEHICAHILEQGFGQMSAHMWYFSHRKLQKDFSRSLLTMCYDQIYFKKCQKRTVTANTEPKIGCFSSTGTRGPHITILIRCGGMAVMWHVGSAICPSLAIHIITTCCSDSWILSVKRSRGGGEGGI